MDWVLPLLNDLAIEQDAILMCTVGASVFGACARPVDVMSTGIAYCPLVPAIQTTCRIGGLNRTRRISLNSRMIRPFGAKATIAEYAKAPENPQLVSSSRGILSETRHRTWGLAEGGGAVARAHRVLSCLKYCGQ